MHHGKGKTLHRGFFGGISKSFSKFMLGYSTVIAKRNAHPYAQNTFENTLYAYKKHEIECRTIFRHR